MLQSSHVTIFKETISQQEQRDNCTHDANTSGINSVSSVFVFQLQTVILLGIHGPPNTLC